MEGRRKVVTKKMKSENTVCVRRGILDGKMCRCDEPKTSVLDIFLTVTELPHSF
jgi:hypothetical protein